MQLSFTSNLMQGHINDDNKEYDRPIITNGMMTIRGLSYSIKNRVKNWLMINNIHEICINCIL